MKNHAFKISEFVLTVDMKPLENGEYLATSPIFPELIAQGRTMAEAIEIAQDVARKLLESYQEHGDSLPKALDKQLRGKNKNLHFQIPVVSSF